MSWLRALSMTMIVLGAVGLSGLLKMADSLTVQRCNRLNHEGPGTQVCVPNAETQKTMYLSTLDP